ncbi:MAG: hypothetical protein ACXWMW_08295 [Syntrophales bacterium]
MDFLPNFIPFLKSYPVWVQCLVSIWIIGFAVIIVILILLKPKALIPPPKDTTVKQEAAIKGSPGAGIQQYHAERDIIIVPPERVEKRSEVKTIQSLMLEARLTCELREGAELPPDQLDFLPVGDAHAYFEGPPGKVRLLFQSPVRFRKLDDNRVVVINRFSIEGGSQLFNRPVAVLANYSELKVPVITVVWGKSLKTIRLLEISIFINNEDPIYSSYKYDVPFKEGPVFTIPIGQSKG